MDDSHCVSDHALCVLLLATSMVHEIGHSAHHHLIGDNNKGFQDASLLAEAGFESESRIFGAKPNVDIRELGSSSRASWQTGEKVSLSNLRERCQGISLLWQTSCYFENKFWSGEYAEHGARALVPKDVAETCRSHLAEMARGEESLEERHVMIPQSITDLFRKKGPSYAQRLYSESSNPKWC